MCLKCKDSDTIVIDINVVKKKKYWCQMNTWDVVHIIHMYNLYMYTCLEFEATNKQLLTYMLYITNKAVK